MGVWGRTLRVSRAVKSKTVWFSGAQQGQQKRVGLKDSELGLVSEKEGHSWVRSSLALDSSGSSPWVRYLLVSTKDSGFSGIFE